MHEAFLARPRRPPHPTNGLSLGHPRFAATILLSRGSLLDPRASRVDGGANPKAKKILYIVPPSRIQRKGEGAS